jgi:hypothetical protein
MRRLLLPVALLVAGCGGEGGDGVFERAQAGLARVTVVAIAEDGDRLRRLKLRGDLDPGSSRGRFRSR